MNDFGSWVQAFRYYDQFWAIIDLKNTLGLEVKALDAMNSSVLGLEWMTQGCELWALDPMNNLGLWMT